MLTQGVHKISAEEYHKDPCVEPSLTRSIIKALVGKTPYHAFWEHPRLNPDYEGEDDSAKFDIGTAAHSIFLEGRNVVTVIDAEDWRKKEAKEARDAARAEGKIPLLKSQADDVLKMVMVAEDSLFRWEGRATVIGDGESELTYIWKESNGVWCRTRPDWISKDRKLCIDYKTTGALANPHTYGRIAIDTGLDIQEAFYTRGIAAIDAVCPEFVFMVQETSAPYLCAFFCLDAMTRDMGAAKVHHGIKLFGQYLKSGKWPDYGNQTYTLEAPPWSLAAWEIKKGEAA